MTFLPLFSLTLCGVDPLHACGTFRAVFGPVRTLSLIHISYGRYQNVFLTDGALADLQASFPTVWGQYIEKLSEYMASTGKRYQSHAAILLYAVIPVA